MAPRYRFAFYAGKPKSRRLADSFSRGCRRAGYDCVVLDFDQEVRHNHIGVFYGVTPESYPIFAKYRAMGRAIYLDNGWLSTPENPTFRFAWNSVQPYLADMPEARVLRNFHPLPDIERKPEYTVALLILQSPQYFTNLRLPYTRDIWQSAVTKLLEHKGYTVETREKPQTRDLNGPTFFQQMATAGIVVSLNSAACVKAIRYGIPAFCTLDCTLSPLAPVKLPDVGMAAPPDKSLVTPFCRRLASYEITRADITQGQALTIILGVPREKRRGYWYGSS